MPAARYPTMHISLKARSTSRPRAALRANLTPTRDVTHENLADDRQIEALLRGLATAIILLAATASASAKAKPIPIDPPTTPTTTPPQPTPPAPPPQGTVRDHRTQPVVRDHRTQPVVRDHRTQPVVRDHRTQPTVRDHRTQKTESVSRGGVTVTSVPRKKVVSQPGYNPVPLAGPIY